MATLHPKLLVGVLACALVSAPAEASDFRAPRTHRSTLTPSGFTVTQEWYWAYFGNGIGRPGMVAADLDGNGSVELVVATGQYWYVLEPRGSGYVQRWVNLPYNEEEIDRLVVAQVDSDPPLEVLVSVGGRLLRYDGATFQLEGELVTAVDEARGLVAANLDGDPAVEAALCNGDGTWVFDLSSGAQQLVLPTLPCTDLAAGETDGTPGVELVVANGTSPGMVVDGATGAVEWSHPLGFGDLVVLGDLDGDLLDEVVAAFHGEGIQVWHGDTHSYYWGLSNVGVDAVTLADVDGDGPLELLFGEDQWGQVHVLEGTTGGERWLIDNPEHGVSRIVVGDVDGDLAREVVFGAGVASRLHVVDAATQALEWVSEDYVGPYYGLAHGDVDADGVPELVFTTSATDGGYDDGLYLVYDAVTKELEYQSPPPTGSAIYEPLGLQVADVDADPELEILLPTSYGYTGALQCRDGLTHDLQWEQVFTDSLSFPSVRVADPDGDGVLEVVWSVAHSYVEVHDAETGGLEWQSFSLGTFFSGDLTLLRVADIDDDGTGEILAGEGGWDGRLIAVDPLLATVDLAVTGLAVTALETVDLDDDGVDDIVVGTNDGWVKTVDPSTGAATDLAGPFAGPVYGLALSELTGDTTLDFVFAAADRVYLVDGATALPEWISEDLGDNVGIYDSLLVGDVDEDGVPEIWVNAGYIGHIIFGIAAPAGSIFADGFEDGTPSAWSAVVP